MGRRRSVLINLKIRSDYEAIRVIGDGQAFEALGEAIRKGQQACLVESDWGPLWVIVRTSDADSPSVSLVRSDEPHPVLWIEGSESGLELLTENLLGLSRSDPPYHWHMEWFEGHFFLKPSSIPCVFELVATDQMPAQ
jgi:hypothetical protein